MKTPKYDFKSNTGNSAYWNIVRAVAASDAATAQVRDEEYDSSWKRRGGVGAYMMLARKWDRIENDAENNGYDIFEAIKANPSDTGLLDDIRDLRRYLLLVESEMLLKHFSDKSLVQKSPEDSEERVDVEMLQDELNDGEEAGPGYVSQ